MSDRILVMSKGAVTGAFTHADATEEKLVAASAIGHGPLKLNKPQGTGN
jgi:erythritol transport system ATP-binding protein